MDRFFDVWFPKIFIGMFVFIASMILLQFAAIGMAAYWVISDPEGAAKDIGTIVGAGVEPIAEILDKSR